MPNYSMRVEWSPEDEVYLASCPELPISLKFGEG